MRVGDEIEADGRTWEVVETNPLAEETDMTDDTTITATTNLRIGATIFTGAGTPELVVGLDHSTDDSPIKGIRVRLLDVGGVPSSRIHGEGEEWVVLNSRVTPTYEQTEELLRTPFKEGRAGQRIYAFGEEVKPGERIEYRTYCNDPTYAEIKIFDLDGTTVGIFTETWDRVMGKDQLGRSIRPSDQIGSGEPGSREETS